MGPRRHPLCVLIADVHTYRSPPLPSPPLPPPLSSRPTLFRHGQRERCQIRARVGDCAGRRRRRRGEASRRRGRRGELAAGTGGKAWFRGGERGSDLRVAATRPTCRTRARSGRFGCATGIRHRPARAGVPSCRTKVRGRPEGGAGGGAASAVRRGRLGHVIWDKAGLGLVATG